MKKSEEKNIEQDQPEIAKFLLKDTVSLRNEIDFTNLSEMVHPLTYSYDIKKHPDLDLIPVLDKFKNKKLKERFLKLHK
ncbi:MAG: hypothetical protein ACTSQJ_07485 [Promethearchaeota archaeon]